MLHDRERVQGRKRGTPVRYGFLETGGATVPSHRDLLRLVGIPGSYSILNLTSLSLLLISVAEPDKNL